MLIITLLSEAADAINDKSRRCFDWKICLEKKNLHGFYGYYCFFCALCVQPALGQVLVYCEKESSSTKVIRERAAVGCLKGYLHQVPSNIHDIGAPDRTPGTQTSPFNTGGGLAEATGAVMQHFVVVLPLPDPLCSSEPLYLKSQSLHRQHSWISF